MSRRSIRLILCGLLLSSTAGAAPDETASELLDNTVSLRAAWQDGRQESGFGIIVGEDDETLIVVTANHVVRGRMPGDVSDSIRVRFHSPEAEPVVAELLPFADSAKDIALLKVPKPVGFRWATNALAPSTEVTRGDEVVYIGRAGDWYIPASFGRINDPRNLEDQIIVDGLNARIGTSGSPLISEGGLIGMVISREADGVTRAIHIGFIKRFTDHYQLPWSLRENTSSQRRQSREAPRIISRLEDGATAYSPSPPTLLRDNSQPSFPFDGRQTTLLTVLARPTLPYELRLKLPPSGPWYLSSLRFIQAPGDPRAYLKAVTVYARSDSNTDWQRIEDLNLQQDISPQVVTLQRAILATEIRFDLKSSWGGLPATIAQIEVTGSKTQ